MAEPARIVRLLSPEEVAELRAAYEKFAPFMLAECPDAEEAREDHPYIRLIHTVEDAWEKCRRLQEENAELQLRLSK